MKHVLRVSPVAASSRFFVGRGLICVVLSLLVFAVYAPVLESGFVNYDDDVYVTDNYQVRQGLSAGGARWALTTFRQGNWHPLTWLSHMLDAQIFGLAPWGHHLTNLLLHLGNTNLLFLVLVSLTGALWPSAVVAAIFGVHPLHVESVAWVAERKDVLSTFLGLLALHGYVGYTRAPNARRYVAAVLLFVLALSAKAMLVTLPFLFLLLDWWPLGRNRSRGGGSRLVPLFLEKAPFLLGSAICVALAFIAQRQAGALAGLDVHDLGTRVANALVSYVSYLKLTVWPSGLAVFYPHRGESLSLGPAAASAILLCSVASLALMFRKGHPYLAVGFFWYLAGLLPVIGLVQAGAQAMADRYTYLPLAGILVMAAWGSSRVIGYFPGLKPLVTTALGAAILLLAWTATAQVAVWKDSVTLFSHALEVTKDNWLAHNNLAMALDDRGRLDEAIRHYEKALLLNPQFPQAHVNLGADLAALGRTEEAWQQYLAALRLDPRSAEAHNNLGVLLDSRGRLREAEEHYRAALAARPDYAAALNNLGAVLTGRGRYAKAVSLYRQALRIDPDFSEARVNLGLALGRAGSGR